MRIDSKQASQMEPLEWDITDSHKLQIGGKRRDVTAWVIKDMPVVNGKAYPHSQGSCKTANGNGLKTPRDVLLRLRRNGMTRLSS